MQFAYPEDVEGFSNELIQIALLRSGSVGGPPIARAEAKSILLVGRVISDLVFLLLRRKWDRYFMIVDREVFIRLRGGNLFPESPLQEVIDECLDQFVFWKKAAITLTVMGGGGIQGMHNDCDHADAVDQARAVLAEIAGQIAPSGERLDRVFIEWMRRQSRVNSFSFPLPVGSPRARAIHVPAKAQIIPRSTSVGVRPDRLISNNIKVAAIADGLLIEAVNGANYLVVGGNTHHEIAAGNVLELEIEAAPVIRTWYFSGGKP